MRLIWRLVSLASRHCYVGACLVVVLGLLWPAQGFSVITLADDQVDGGDGKVTIVRLESDFQKEDAEQFHTHIIGLTRAIISLNSPGGSPESGIAIGLMIRNRHFFTMVSSQNKCESACALAWLGGVKRFAAEGKRVAFHRVFKNDNGGTRVGSGPGDATIGYYIRDLGLGKRALDFVVSAPPDEEEWLTPEQGRHSGIDYEVIRNRQQVVDELAPRPPCGVRSLLGLACSWSDLGCYLRPWASGCGGSPSR